MLKFIRQFALGAACFALSAGIASAWSLEEAAKPYKGTEISVIFLDRPGYRAIMKMLPDFEQKTGIKVNFGSGASLALAKLQTMSGTAARSLSSACRPSLTALTS